MLRAASDALTGVAFDRGVVLTVTIPIDMRFVVQVGLDMACKKRGAAIGESREC
jgi:hypothetical protein